MEQQIEEDLLKEFEAELKEELSKAAENKLNIISSQSEALDKFWNKFLTEEFPTGQINAALEKNFAIYICQNRLDIENIKGVYTKNKWSYQGLVGWIKKVNAGDLKTFNVKELLQWANTYKPEVVNLLEEAKQDIENPLEELPVFPIDELDNLPERENTWLCNRLVRPQSIQAISGKRATLKTWFALSLAYSIATNIPFLEKFKTECSNVLFVDAESNKDELKKRKTLVKKYLNLDNSNNLFVLSEYNLKLDTQKGIKQLKRTIKRLNIKLVILDSYRRFIGFDENDATATSRFFVDVLKPICNETGCSFLFIHHQKKGKSEGDDMDTIRGSSDFVNLMDGIIQVSKVGNLLTIKQTKNKFDTEVPEFNVELQTDRKTFLGFKFLGVNEPYEIVCARAILKWAAKKRTFQSTKAKEFAESKNFKEYTFKKALNELIERNLIQKGKSHKSPYKVLSVEWGAADIC